MATYEALKQVVTNGCNLTLAGSTSQVVIIEILELAKTSGAKITLNTSMDEKLMLEISKKYGNSVSFINGLDEYKK